MNKSSKETIKNWQYYTFTLVEKLDEEKCVTVTIDEAFCINQNRGDTKLWSKIDTRVPVEYKEKNGRIVIFGAVTNTGEQLFVTSDEFNSKTFLMFLKKEAVFDNYINC